MKKFLAIALAAVMLFALAACGGNTDDNNNDNDNEDNRNNRRDLGEHLIDGGTLGLAEEGFCAACDSAGKTLLLAVLHKNSDKKEESCSKKNNAKNDFDSSHR